MTEALAVFVPLFAFMLIPLWIPVVAVLVGAVTDRLVSNAPSAAAAAVDEAKARSAAARGEGEPVRTDTTRRPGRRRRAAVEPVAA